ncbi:MAG: transcriptional repressor LexA [Chitinivibrionales bacterium]|nr:transcriptional repressor LexA [Chitinivibrionales bacterium]
MKPLTPEQNRVLHYIISHQRATGSPPTVREIAAHLGYNSVNNARQHLRLIERKGYLRQIPGKARGIEVAVGFEVEVSDNEVQAPLVGRVAAGQPITAVENLEGYVTLDRSIFRGEGLFTLRIKGESMCDAGILDGDIVIVRQQAVVENGEIAVVIVDGEATLKRFIREYDKIILRAENPEFADMVFFDDREIWIAGKLVGVMRKC